MTDRLDLLQSNDTDQTEIEDEKAQHMTTVDLVESVKLDAVEIIKRISNNESIVFPSSKREWKGYKH